MKNDKGIALVIVLVTIMFLSIFGLAAYTMASSSVSQGYVVQTFEEDYYDAESGTVVAMDSVVENLTASGSSLTYVEDTFAPLSGVTAEDLAELARTGSTKKDEVIADIKSAWTAQLLADTEAAFNLDEIIIEVIPADPNALKALATTVDWTTLTKTFVFFYEEYTINIYSKADTRTAMLTQKFKMDTNGYVAPVAPIEGVREKVRTMPSSFGMRFSGEISYDALEKYYITQNGLKPTQLKRATLPIPSWDPNPITDQEFTYVMTAPAFPDSYIKNGIETSLDLNKLVAINTNKALAVFGGSLPGVVASVTSSDVLITNEPVITPDMCAGKKAVICTNTKTIFNGDFSGVQSIMSTIGEIILGGDNSSPGSFNHTGSTPLYIASGVELPTNNNISVNLYNDLKVENIVLVGAQVFVDTKVSNNLNLSFDAVCFGRNYSGMFLASNVTWDSSVTPVFMASGAAWNINLPGQTFSGAYYSTANTEAYLNFAKINGGLLGEGTNSIQIPGDRLESYDGSFTDATLLLVDGLFEKFIGSTEIVQEEIPDIPGVDGSFSPTFKLDNFSIREER